MSHRVPTGKPLIPVFEEDPKHPLQGWLGSDCKWYDKGCTHFPLSDGDNPSYCTYYKGNPCRSYFPKDLKCPECSSTFIGKTMEFDFFCYKCMTIIKVNSEEVDKYFEEISKEEVVKK